MIPHIRQADGQIGFSWVTPDGRLVSLPELIASDPGRPGWCPPTCPPSTTR